IQLSFRTGAPDFIAAETFPVPVGMFSVVGKRAHVLQRLGLIAAEKMLGDLQGLLVIVKFSAQFKDPRAAVPDRVAEANCFFVAPYDDLQVVRGECSQVGQENGFQVDAFLCFLMARYHACLRPYGRVARLWISLYGVKTR